MTPATETSLIHYRLCSESDAEELALLLADAFSAREPIGQAIQMTAAEFGAFVRPQLRNAAVRDLTIVARRSDTGELVGAMLTEDGASDTGPQLDTMGEKFAMVGSILGRLGEMVPAGDASAPGETLHLFLLGVAEAAEGNGIGQGMVAACIENGARKGYRRAVAECTGRTSQHIFRKLGFVDRATVPYAEHEFKGRRIFAGIAEHGGPILMEKTLDAAN